MIYYPRGEALSEYNQGVARKRKLNLKCPTCKRPVESREEEFPFCSERCRLIDLGKWASGEYVVSSPATDISDDSEIPKFPASNDED